MSTHRISDAAKARQEAARHADGRFGTQPHDPADFTLSSEDMSWAVGFEEPEADSSEQVAEELVSNEPTANIDPSAEVDESATIDPTAKIGENAIIERGAVIGKNAVIGKGSYIREYAEIGEGVHVEDLACIDVMAQIKEDAHIGKDASIGENVYIGPQVHVEEQARIDDHAMIMGGANIEGGARIGMATSVGANSIIGYDARIASDVFIGDNSSVGGKVGEGTAIHSGCDISNESRIGEGVSIRDGVTTEGAVAIGDDTYIGPDVRMRATGYGYGAASITIGKSCLIDRGAVLEADGDSRMERVKVGKYPARTYPCPTIEANQVWVHDRVSIGENAKIARSRIGTGAKIGNDVAVRDSLLGENTKVASVGAPVTVTEAHLREDARLIHVCAEKVTLEKDARVLTSTGEPPTLKDSTIEEAATVRMPSVSMASSYVGPHASPDLKGFTKVEKSRFGDGSTIIGARGGEVSSIFIGKGSSIKVDEGTQVGPTFRDGLVTLGDNVRVEGNPYLDNGVTIGRGSIVGIRADGAPDTQMSLAVPAPEPSTGRPRTIIGQDTYVHDGSRVEDGATTGKNASVGMGAEVRASAQIGEYATVDDNAVIGVGAVIGENARIERGARVADYANVPRHANVLAFHRYGF